ncbi:ABC transporter ATP-binding protein [Aureimonas sp. Leaf454]|uniref:ABC transporter ATP-binding protein n=1 Tax=Aureimonas sp. Leaf454 TaxID=1736381 RepID=UPI0006FC8A58|nr:ABC transporter ATP-binding protein [Aureimonas sp. Leaf454]KQT44598.1 ABC transporter ATP-binding protein [Aureimonas sp. Leaf454]
MTALLDVRDLSAFYGASQALFSVDVALGEGEVVALAGRNGMGKTTTIRSICGLVSSRARTLRLAGCDIAGTAPHRIARLGIGLVPEGRRCFRSLSVRENLLVAARKGPWTLSRVEALFPRLAERRDQSAGLLSGGEQQMVAIGRALMTNPRLLILDEATEGLAPLIRKEIWAAIHALKGERLAILVVDKTLSELLPIADRCVVLENGRTVWTGHPADLSREMQERYLGV